MPIISIIVPVYKVEKYLNRCIDCILAQTYADFELILVDDGSPDRSGSICDEYASKDIRIKVIHKENGGVSSARNVGITNSSGSYLYFIDGDDWIEPSTLSDVARHISKGKDIIIHGIADDYPDENREIHPQYFDISSLDESDMLLNLDRWKLLNGPVNKLFKRDILVNNNILFDERIAYGEDTKFTFEYLVHCNNFYFIPEHYYHYIHRKGEGLTNKNYNYEQLFAIAKMLVEVRKPASIRFSFNSEHIDYIQHVYIQHIIMGIRSLYNKPTKKKLNKRIAIFRNQELLEITHSKNIYGISQIRLSYLLRYPILFDAIMCLSTFLKHPII